MKPLNSLLVQRLSPGGPRRPRRLQLRYGRLREMQMGSAHANSVALCLYLIRDCQSFGKEDLGTVNFFFFGKISQKKIQPQNMYKNTLSKIP